LQVGIGALIKILSGIKEAKVKWPTRVEMTRLAALVHDREPLLEHTFGFVDGLNLPVEEPQSVNKQNANYNGWKSACFASNVLAYSSTGKVIFAAINYPGSWHDAEVARYLYSRLRNRTPDGYNILADSAFPASKKRQGKILVVKKEESFDRINDPVELYRKRRLNNAVVRQRQAAEWGMRSIQGAWARVKLPLPENDKYRASVLKLVVLLHNYRAEFVGLNQIHIVFSQ
jgi:hypothetical protein